MLGIRMNIFEFGLQPITARSLINDYFIFEKATLRRSEENRRKGR